MADLSGFNANDVQPVSFDLIPDGWYEAMITDSEMKDASTGGEYLKLTFTILQEPYKDRLQWENLNLKNKNEKAVQIAKGKLSAICRAVNVLTPKDSTDLHNLPLLVKIGHEKRQDNGEEKNVLKDYKAKGAPQSTAQAPKGNKAKGAPQSTAQAPKGNAASPAPVSQPAGAAPWKR